MTATRSDTVTIRVDRELLPQGSGSFYAEVDRAKFLPVYQAFQTVLDADPHHIPLRAAASVMQMLSSDGWPQEEARHYAIAARFCYIGKLDPRTGHPLVGLDRLDRHRVQEIRNLVRSALPQDMDADQVGATTDRLMNVLAYAGHLH